jgi:CheY-like chemotaxis protein
LKVNSASIITYIDPQVMGSEISMALKAEEVKTVLHSDQPLDIPAAAAIHAPHSDTLKATADELEHFRAVLQTRPARRQLQFLIVEDQQLLRRLLQEVLREGHLVDMAAGLQEGWKSYLEKAPDITFLDIGLGDGNGHTLAHMIKQLDPTSYVVMVTANNNPEEIEKARANHTDGFVVKPYNKQQIFTCVDKYIAQYKEPAFKGRRP